MKLPFLIGLTGAIGAGKSTAADEMRKLGAAVVVGDELGKRALEESPVLLQQIRNRFGAAVFGGSGELDRAALGKKVFASRDDSRWLTSLTFPRIYALWRETVLSTSAEVLVFDAALIFEWGIEAEFDLIVLITAPHERILERMERSGRLSGADVRERLFAQIPADVKAASAHVVLSNDGTPPQLRRKVQDLWQTRISPEIQVRRQETHEANS